MSGLWQAILDEPFAVDLRLIYADALDDSGDEHRAEFVRVQCELETCTERTRRSFLKEREKELLVHWHAWLPDLPDRYWLRHGPLLIQRTPIVEVLLDQPDHGRFDLRCTDLNLAGKDYWIWHQQVETYNGNSQLPIEIYNLLEGAVNPHHKQYLSQEDAMHALTHACLRYAREKK